MLNLLTIQAGQCVRLQDGTVAEVTENIGDGIWLQLRHGGSDDDELVHCEEIVERVEETARQIQDHT